MTGTKQVISIIAESYRDAALAGINMRAATEAFETMRSAMLLDGNPLDAWDTIDDQVNRSFEVRGLQPLLIDLREQWKKVIFDDEYERLDNLFENDPKNGWIAWLHSFAAALTRFRLDLCNHLCERPLPFSDTGNFSIQQIVLLNDRAYQGRWAEAFDLFMGLGEYEVLEKTLRARSLSIAAEIAVYQFNQYDSAFKILEQAQCLAPDDWRVTYGWGTYYLQQQGEENRKKSKEWYQRTMENAPDVSLGYTGFGECLEREDDLNGAEARYLQASRSPISPSDGYTALLKLHNQKVMFESRKYSIDVLVEQLKAVAVSGIDIYNAMLNAGEAYQRNGMNDQAHQWYQRAIEFDSKLLNAYTSEGYLYLDNKLYQQAVENFNRAIDAAPEAMEGYWGMAWVTEEQKNWAEMLHWCQESLKRRPQWGDLIHARMATIHNRIGNQFFENNQYQDAISSYEKAVDLDNQKPIYQCNLGRAYGNLLTPDWGKMIEHCQRAVELRRVIKDDTSELKYYYDFLSEAYFDDGRLKEFEELFETSGDLKDQKDKKAAIYNQISNRLFQNNQYSECIKYYGKAIELSPDTAVYHENLALAWENIKDPGMRLAAIDNAVNSMRRASILEPSNDSYNKDLEFLETKKVFATYYGESVLDNNLIVTPIAVEVAADLIPFVEGSGGEGLSSELTEMITDMRNRILDRYGVKIPGIRFRGNEDDLPDGTYIIMLNEIPLVSGNISTETRLYSGSPEELKAQGIAGEEHFIPFTSDNAFWISRDHWDVMETGGSDLWKVFEYPIRHLEAVLQKNLAEFVGHQEVMNILEPDSDIPEAHIAYAKDNLTVLTQLLRGLVCEEASIKPVKQILEIFYESCNSNNSLLDMVEQLRSLPEVCQMLPGNEDKFQFYRLSERFETVIEQSIYSVNSCEVLALEPEICQQMLTEVRNSNEAFDHVAILVKNERIRSFVRKLIEIEFTDIPVLSSKELFSGFVEKIAGEIDLELVEFVKPSTFSNAVPEMKDHAIHWKEELGANLLDAGKPVIRVIVNDAILQLQNKADDKPIKEMFDLMRDGLFYELGIILPEVEIEIDNMLKESEFKIQLNDHSSPSFAGLDQTEFLVNDTVDRLTLLNIKGRKAINPANGSEFAIVMDEGNMLDTCQNAGLTAWGPAGFIVLNLSAEIRKRAHIFMTKEVFQYNLDLFATAFPDLAKPAIERFGIDRLTLILKGLLEEEISIRDLRSILEGLLSINAISDVDLSKYIVFAPNTGMICFTSRAKTLDSIDITDYSNCVRMSLKRYISHKYTRGANTLVVYLMEPKIEQRIREIAINPLSNEEASKLTEAVYDEVGTLPPTAQNPVILTSVEIRRTLWKLIENDFPNLAVVCYQELSPEMNIQPIARISWE